MRFGNFETFPLTFPKKSPVVLELEGVGRPVNGFKNRLNPRPNAAKLILYKKTCFFKKKWKKNEKKKFETFFLFFFIG